MTFCELFNLLTDLIREKVYWRVVTLTLPIEIAINHA